MGWDIIGHEWAVELLSRHIARGEVRHAYLFCGPLGVGRRTLALRFAQALNCTQPTAPGVPCRACRDCRQIEALQHPDLLDISKESDKTQTSIDQIRSFQHMLYLTPVQARYKIGLLLHFQGASAGAQNALLKILEEPPSKVILLLTSDTPESVLPTVMSRCEVLRLRPLEAAALARALAGLGGAVTTGEGMQILQTAARVSAGKPGAALRLVRDAKALQEREELLQAGFEIFGLSRRERLALAAQLFGGAPGQVIAQRERLRQALEVWVSLWRDILLCAGGAAGAPDADGWDSSPLVNRDTGDMTAEAARQVGFVEARLQLGRLEEAARNLEPPYHTSPRLLGEALLLEWPVV